MMDTAHLMNFIVESNIVLTHTLGGKKNTVMKIRFKNKPIFQNKISSCSLPAYMTIFFFFSISSPIFSFRGLETTNCNLVQVAELRS